MNIEKHLFVLRAAVATHYDRRVRLRITTWPPDGENAPERFLVQFINDDEDSLVSGLGETIAEAVNDARIVFCKRHNAVEQRLAELPPMAAAGSGA